MMQYLFTKTPLYFFVQSFWRDEGFSYLLASKNILELLSITAKDFNPPFYYLVLHYWMLIFGTSEIALRTLSLLFFALTLYIVFDILTLVLKISWWKGLLYLSLFIINPLMIYYAFEARMYSMVMFFAALSMYAFLRKHNRLYIAATILGLYTHYFLLFIVIVQGIWLFLQHPKKKAYLHSLRPLIISVVVFVPWIIYTLISKSDDGSFWVPVPKWKDLLYLPSVIYSGYEKDFGKRNHNIVGYTSLISWLNLLLIGLNSFGSYFVWNKDKKHHSLLYLLLMWTFIPPITVFLISFVYDSYYLPRYLIFSAVGLLLLIIYLLEMLPTYIRLVFIGLVFILTLQYQKLNVKYRQKYSFYSMSRQIQSLANPSYVIYVTDVKDFHVAQYYFGTDRVYLYDIKYDDIPSFVGKVLISPDNVTFKLPSYPSRAFIITYNNWYRIASQL